MIESTGFWDLITRRAIETPDALFAVDERDRRLSFAEYLAACVRCAAGLHARGIAADGCVSWVLPTTLESMIVMGALSRLGVRQNPILPIYRHKEVGFVTRQSKAQLLIVPSEFRGFDYAQMARDLAVEQPGLETLVVDDVLPEGDPEALPPPPGLVAVAADGPVRWLMYTSGTTADPKGALHTDATVMAFAEGLVRVLDLQADDRIAMVFPITHVGGVGWLVAGLMTGAAQIAVSIFDPKTTVDVLARNGVTQATAGTAFHQVYLEAQRKNPGQRLFPKVRSFPGGGAPKPPQLHYELVEEMGGVGIVSGYGLTECPITTMNSIVDPSDKLAQTEGRANPAQMRIKIVAADGTTAAAGEEGEIRALGPQLCKGYLDASLNEAAFDEEGFFCTGDLGILDAEGFLTITGRLKDVIIRNGENISAKEVEDLLYQHPKVADAAVIGLPDPKTGERCCAVVASQDGADPIGFDEMVDFLRGKKIMLQKIPEQLEWVDELPRNATGKVLKHELRKTYGGE